MTGPGLITAAQTSPIRNDLQHEITRHLMTAAVRLQSLPVGKRLVLKIERNAGRVYTFGKNEEETAAYQAQEATQQPVEPLNTAQRADFAAQADKIRQIATGLQDSESVTFTITRSTGPNLLFSTMCPARLHTRGGALARMNAASRPSGAAEDRNGSQE